MPERPLLEPADVESSEEPVAKRKTNGRARVLEEKDLRPESDSDVDANDSDDSEPAPHLEPLDSRSPIRQFGASLSDRQIQKITGGNAFIRGRIYARRNAIERFDLNDEEVSGSIRVRNVDEPYEPRVRLDDKHRVVSECNCPGFRGPTGHCKHVAALLVALRDRERPPRTKDSKRRSAESTPVHVPGTVSVGGKRRRSKKRRRGLDLSFESHTTRNQDSRGALDAWMPPQNDSKDVDFDYRLTVRSASILVTPVLSGTKSNVPIGEALTAFDAIPAEERPRFRALARHINRSKATQAELRAEDAAEFIGLLKNKKALLEPNSMELRFQEEPLRPTIDMELQGDDQLRLRVGFEAGGRKVSLSTGAWFEGTPCYHIDTHDGIVRPIVDSVTPAWLTRFYKSPALVHPLSDLPYLLTDFIPRVANAIGAELPELESVADVVDASPKLVMRATGDIIGAHVQLKATYDGQDFDIPVDGIPAPLAFFPPEEEGGRPRVIRRDVGTEMMAVQTLLNLGFEVDEDETELLAEGDDAVRFWTEGVATLPASWRKLVPSDLADVRINDSSVTPQMRVSSGVDWLSLDMTFSAGGVAVDPDDLRQCLEKGSHMVKLEDGSFAPVEADEVEEILARMAEIEATSGGAKKLSVAQAGRVQDLLRLVDKSHVTPKAKTLFGHLENITEIKNVAKPRSLKAKLRDYQKAGFNWLVFVHELGSGGILADDMGLGKTLQTITLLLWAKSKMKKGTTHVVVAPTSVVPNWQREIEKFAPSLSTLVWQGPKRHEKEDEFDKVDIVITSYALIRRDEELLQSKKFGYVILDEAQHIKNPHSATAKAVKGVESERRLALTGTPIENRLSEFWSILDFVSPGLLGDLKTFEEKVARPIDRGDQNTADKLRNTIKPFVLRRTKRDVAPELPEKIEQEMVVPMADEQSDLYGQILEEIRKSVLSEVEKKGVAKSQIQILAALTRLRQVACDPRLTKIDGQWDDETSGKLGALREILENAKSGGHRVLIFSQFVQMLQLIRAALDEDGINYEYLDGSTKNRIDKVDAFNEDESITAFLISLKAGGTGLNLVGADTVIHFDPWWNPAVEDQATDRAHRIGQKRSVSVYRLIAKGTVEEKILQLSAKKRALMENVLSTEGSPLKGLTKADVDALFSN